MTTIHINDRVRFKPTVHFVDCYDRHASWHGLKRRLFRDDDGFCEMFFWEFLQVAGPHTGLGQPSLYESDGIQVFPDSTSKRG